jgi:hypothetical protein
MPRPSKGWFPTGSLVFILVVGASPPASTPPNRAPQTPAPGSVPHQKKPAKGRSFLAWLAQATGVTASSGALRGDSGVQRGEVWVQPLAGGEPYRLAAEESFSWPVFAVDDRQVLALRDGAIWSIPADAGPPVLLVHPQARIVGLVGSGAEGLVVLTADQVGTLDVHSGEITPFTPTSEEDRDEIARLRSAGRAYDEGRLQVAERNGLLIVTEGGRIRELAFPGAASWQPSVSHDRSRIIFIRTMVAPL